MTPKWRQSNRSSRPGEAQDHPVERFDDLPHQPVLMDEVIEALSPAPGKILLDATTGYAGHARRLAPLLGSQGLYLGIDCDPEALAYSRRILEASGTPFQLIHSRFDRLEEVLRNVQPPHLDGILFDLGISSPQVDEPGRGFSFMLDGPLDMRMNPEEKTSAADLVNSLEEKELSALLWQLGEERRAKAVAHAIVQARKEKPFETTLELSDLVRKTLRSRKKKGLPKQIHPATKTFMALRIAVNKELERLGEAIDQAIECLSPGGRLAVISYHSLEDRIVKNAFRLASGACTCPPGLPECACGAKRIVRLLTSHPIRPEAAEIERNARARSARLRIAEKVLEPRKA